VQSRDKGANVQKNNDGGQADKVGQQRTQKNNCGNLRRNYQYTQKYFKCQDIKKTAHL
jgi:hypothetical protein